MFDPTEVKKEIATLREGLSRLEGLLEPGHGRETPTAPLVEAFKEKENDEEEMSPEGVTFPLFYKSLSSALLLVEKDNIPKTQLDWIDNSVTGLSKGESPVAAPGVTFVWTKISVLNGKKGKYVRLFHKYNKHIVTILSSIKGDDFYTHFNKKEHTRGIFSSNSGKIDVLVGSLCDISKYIVVVDFLDGQSDSKKDHISYSVFSHTGS